MRGRLADGVEVIGCCFVDGSGTDGSGGTVGAEVVFTCYVNMATAKLKSVVGSHAREKCMAGGKTRRRKKIKLR